MSFSKLAAGIFGIAFIVILYFILFYALKIMYKDVKTGGKRRRPTHDNKTNNNNMNKHKRKSHGLEIINTGNIPSLKQGGIIPVNGDITIGRKEDNQLILQDQHVSGHHAILSVINDVLYIEDLNSTNGTLVNNKKIRGKVKLFSRDEVSIGAVKFKVLG